MGKCGSHVVSGGSQQPSHSLPSLQASKQQQRHLEQRHQEQPDHDISHNNHRHNQSEAATRERTVAIEAEGRRSQGSTRTTRIIERYQLTCVNAMKEEYYADQTRKFLQAQWSRMTLMVIRCWETESVCLASNTRHKVKHATNTYQQVKDMDGAYCAWAMKECDNTSSLDFRRFVSWLNSATAAPAAVEAVVTRPPGSSSASATTPATPAAATTPGSASAPTPATPAAAT